MKVFYINILFLLALFALFSCANKKFSGPSRIEELERMDPKGTWTSADVIKISPTPLGKSDTLAVNVWVKKEPPAGYLAVKLIIDNKNFYSFDDGSNEMLRIYPKVLRDSLISFPFIIKNKVKLIGYNLIIYAKTSSDTLSNYLSSDSRSIVVSYK